MTLTQKKLLKANAKLTFCFGLLCSAPVIANEFSLVSKIASEPLTRGISRSPDDPITALMFEWDNPTGLFAGAQAYASSRTSSTRRSKGLSIHGGWFHLVGEDQAVEYSFSNYHFPGNFAIDWDYQEIQVDYHHTRNLSFNIAYSDNYFNRGTASTFLGANWQRMFNNDVYLFTHLGVRKFEQSIYSDNIYNGTLGVGYAINNEWDVKFSIEHADDNVEFFLGKDSAGTRLFASLSYLIF